MRLCLFDFKEKVKTWILTAVSCSLSQTLCFPGSLSPLAWRMGIFMAPASQA